LLSNIPFAPISCLPLEFFNSVWWICGDANQSHPRANFAIDLAWCASAI
jgi:hypothetical protein